MKHSILYIYVCLSLCMLAGCQKYSDEDYEGQWQLTEIALPDGSDAQDVKANGVYWRIQLNILQVMCTGLEAETHPGELIGRFHVSESIFHLTQIYQHEREADLLITDPDVAATFAPFGITTPTTDYHIDTLTESRMVLTSPTLRLTFRKF